MKEETYEELNSHLPNTGDFVHNTGRIKGRCSVGQCVETACKVIVTLDNDEKEIREYKASELKFKPRRKKKDVRISKEEMAELRALEERNGASKLDDE